MNVADQVVVLWAVTNGHLDDVPLADVAKVEERLLVAFNTNRKLKEHLESKKELDDTSIKELEKLVLSVLGKGKTATAEPTPKAPATKPKPKVKRLKRRTRR